jgi:hypothetical protein
MGKLTGSRFHRTRVLKSKIDGRAPLNPVQERSFLAFGSLCRMAAGIAKTSKSNWTLDTSKMLPHNYIAQYLKPCVRNHFFDWQAINDVIPTNNTLVIPWITWDRGSGAWRCQIAWRKVGVSDAAVCYFYLFRTDGTLLWSYMFSTRTAGVLTGNTPLNYGYGIFPMLIVYDTSNNIWSPVLATTRGEAGMRYSTTEQLTGDIALNGKPIYQITLHATGTITNQALELGPPPANMEDYIMGWGTIDVGTQIYPLVYAYAGSTTTSTVALYADATRIRIIFSPNYSGSAEYWATIQYTKSTDSPIQGALLDIKHPAASAAARRSFEELPIKPDSEAPQLTKAEKASRKRPPKGDASGSSAQDAG